ncbi:MAG: DUF1080 domain-containing protein [Pedosphaera sp.]|nr:DUF1080 domain-containing protein [Pedosphaera sp.]
MKTPLPFTAALLLATMTMSADDATPFNGKSLDGWKTKGAKEKSRWTVGSATMSAEKNGELAVAKEGTELVNAKSGGIDIYSEAAFGDAIIELEVMVPKGSNSGIYVMGEYEIQVFDSFGKAKPGGGDMGALYGAQPPRVNASKKPGEWQKYEIHFKAPRFDADGKKTSNAVFQKVILNGQVLHENVEMPKGTPGGVDGKEKAKGPIMFQGDHGPVAYRNIAIKPLK